jgi:endonuclease/exonuclease/phosphatase (EEP) superfamily protein YafD
MDRAASTSTTDRRRLRRVLAAKVLAVLYPLALLATIVAFRTLGERWWVATVGLYLPRLVLAAPLPLLAGLLAWLRLRRWLWTQLPSALLLVFPLLGFVLPWPHAAGAGSIRVLSYNVNSGRGGVDGIVEEIDRFSPDVVLMQETGRNEGFEPLLRARYSTFSMEDQFILASRFPLAAMTGPDKIPFEGHQRSPRFLRYVLDTPHGPIVFYNVHPVSPREDFEAIRGKGLRSELLSGRVLSGAAAPRIQINTDLRVIQVTNFADAARRETGPVLIAGDTNLPGLSPVLARELSSFTDGFAQAGWGLGYTYPNDRRPWMRIDRMFAAGGLRFAGFEVGQSKASDHLCVVADVTW